MKRLFYVLIIHIFFLSGCVKPRTLISQADFLKENQSLSFDNWKNWGISYGSGKYIAILENDTSEHRERLGFFGNDSIDYREQLIFWERDSLCIRLCLPDTTSKIFSFRTLVNDSLWKRYPSMNKKIDDLKSHIDFMLKYKLERVYHVKDPSRIYFQSDSINLIYLVEPIDSSFGLYTNKINEHWYSREISALPSSE